MDSSFCNVLIKTFDTKKQVSDIYGTGFLWIPNQNAYIVTCKHVITGTMPTEHNINIPFDKITIFWKSFKSQKINQFSIDLFKDGKPVWLEHTDPTVDVVIIPFPQDEINEEMSFISFSTLDDKIYSSESKVYMYGLENGKYDETLSYKGYIGEISRSLNDVLSENISEYEFPLYMTSYPGQSGTLIHLDDNSDSLGILSKTPIVDGEKLPITIAVKIKVLDEILTINRLS